MVLGVLPGWKGWGGFRRPAHFEQFDRASQRGIVASANASRGGMPKHFYELSFNPPIQEIVQDGEKNKVAVFTGGNNSGKSAYLKMFIDKPGKLYIGVNRFYSFHHLGLYNFDPNEIHSWHSSMNNQRNSQYQNFEGSFFNAATAIVRLSNERRKVLFDTFEDLFGIAIVVEAENPDNEFSQKYVSIGGDSLSVTSSGTRLFLGILAALMDDRFDTVAIDEPELGLSPSLQRQMSEIIIRGDRKSDLFPHSPNIVISTHSHLFLDRMIPKNNWIVSRIDKFISAKNVASISELHDIQFRLLGNDLGELFLPHVVIFVEGETDKLFIETYIKSILPRLRYVVQDCGGNIAARLTYWAETMGDIQLSPYRSRVFAVSDSEVQAGLERACRRLKLPDEALVRWSQNGIEFLYPKDIMARIFKVQSVSNADIEMGDDDVTVAGMSYKKMDLCKMICAELADGGVAEEEFIQKLISPIQSLDE